MNSSTPAGQVTAYALLVATSLCVGYWAGVKSRPTSNGLELKSKPAATRHEPSRVAEESDDEGSEASSTAGDGDIASLRVQEGEECKLVLVVRTDLGMTSGKIAAQCSHATLACYKTLLSTNSALLRQWERAGQTKIALRCQNEDELLLLQAQAQSLNLCARSIQDAGRTQIAAGSRTVLGIAGPARLVNQITGKLRLL
ncbi:putative peptidyl-tRNA hydrolase PTH2 [Lyophyllum shimeji]|uniref:peptidyl-tRNA hydrolase n=1 Tax=Lyophyllum shimeji TaxID=47721 RepID=A0A9P3UMJ3_LYOSH|nr:putative peptidyl-tRNA hydrolase PTH2 [Lyophyllum shimeji]